MNTFSTEPIADSVFKVPSNCNGFCPKGLGCRSQTQKPQLDKLRFWTNSKDSYLIYILKSFFYSRICILHIKSNIYFLLYFLSKNLLKIKTFCEFKSNKQFPLVVHSYPIFLNTSSLRSQQMNIKYLMYSRYSTSIPIFFVNQ